MPRPRDPLPATPPVPVDAAPAASAPDATADQAATIDPVDPSAETLAAAVGAEWLALPTAEAWSDARFLRWTAEDARARDGRVLQETDAAFLARGAAFLARVQARRFGVRRLDPRAGGDSSPTPAGAPRAVHEGARCAWAEDRGRGGSAASRRVPVVELGVAAGPGRELWDEPPERWLPLPDDLPGGPYLALRIVGSSMSPLLATDDVVLVRPEAALRANHVVVARHPDDGYVCKRIRRAGRTQLELDSLEPGHSVLVIPRDPALVVGVVVGMWPGPRRG